MPNVTPPDVVVREFVAPVTHHTRRVEIYEKDGVTRWAGDDKVRLVDGSVNADYSRGERRSLDLVLNNSDGGLVTGPGAFWYDKIIKVFRGAVVNETGYQPKIIVIGDKQEALAADGYIASNFRTTLSSLGFKDVTIRTSATAYADVSGYDIFVFLGGSTPTQLDIALDAYNAGKSVFLQGKDATGWVEANLTGVSSVSSATGMINPVPTSAHLVSNGWSPFQNTVQSLTNLFTNPSFETASGTVEVRRNLVQNPSFETNTTGWVANAGGTITRVTTGSGITQGVAAGELTLQTTNQSGVNYPVTLAGSTTHTASIDITPVSGDLSTLILRTADAAGTRANLTISGLVVGQTTRVSVTWASSATPGTSYFDVWRNGTGASVTVLRLDRVLIEASSTVNTYFDGTTPPKVRRNLVGQPDVTGASWQRHPNMTNPGVLVPAPDNLPSFWGRRTLTGITAIWGCRDAGTSMALTGGVIYTLSIWVYTSAVETGLQIRVSLGALATYAPQSAVFTSVVGWQKVSLTFTPGSTGNWAILLTTYNGASGADYALAGPIVELGSTVGTYFDGSTSPTQGYLPAWEGTANASPSYLYDGDLTQSWVGTANASASVLTAPGVPGGPSGPAPGRVTWQSSHWSTSGGKSIRMRALSNSSDTFHSVPVTMPASVAGKTFTMMGTVRAEQGLTAGYAGNWRKFRVAFNTPGGQNEPSVTYSDVPENAAGEWFVRGTFTVPADATGTTFIRIQNGDGGGGSDVWWDDILLVEGDYSGDYFDGSTVNDQNTYAWTAGANASTSTLVTSGTKEYTITDPRWSRIAEGVSDPAKALGGVISDVATGGRLVALTFQGQKSSYADPQFVNLLKSSITWLDSYEPITTWETQIGEFMIDRITDSSFPHTVKLTGRDYTKKCLNSKFAYATQFTTGLALESVIASIAGAAGITRRNLPATGITVNRSFFYERGVTRWDAIKDIADSYDYEIYFDPYGYLVMRQYNDPALTSPSIVIHPGPEGQLVSWEKSTSDSRLYNHVIVTGDSSDASVLPASGEAINTDINSPTSVDKIGDRLYQYVSSFIQTDIQAQAVADSFLAVHSLEEFEISFASLLLPWLDVGEIIGFTDSVETIDNGGDPTTFLLSSLTIPLGLGQMSSVGKRITVVG